MADVTPRQPGGEAAPEPGRSAVELLIDEIVDDSFPASDPPAWGVAASRLERSLEADRAALTNAADRGSGGRDYAIPLGESATQPAGPCRASSASS